LLFGFAAVIHYELPLYSHFVVCSYVIKLIFYFTKSGHAHIYTL